MFMGHVGCAASCVGDSEFHGQSLARRQGFLTGELPVSRWYLDQGDELSGCSEEALGAGGRAWGTQEEVWEPLRSKTRERRRPRCGGWEEQPVWWEGDQKGGFTWLLSEEQTSRRVR